MKNPIDENSLDVLFRQARTHNGWREEPVDIDLLTDVWNLARMGPTSANCSPARIVFAVSREAKERLKPCLMAGNVEQAMTAPATAIIGYDLEFHERLPELFPHADARSWFVGKEAHIRTTAFRNGTLQGAYFMLAARALGLDCGPMSGFDNDQVDQAFFAGTSIQSNFVCNLGYGNPDKLYPRNKRLEFDEACSIV